MTLERRRAALEVVLCSGYPTQLALAATLQGAGLAPLGSDGKLSAGFVFTLSLLDAALLISLVLFLLVRSGDSPGQVFLGGRNVAREARLGLALLPFTLGLVFGLLWLLHAVAPALRNVPQNPLEALLTSRANFILFLAVAVLAGGIREELQRAFLLHRFEQRLGGRAVGLTVTSLAFGLGHTLQGWDAAAATGTLGLLWGSLYLVRRSAIAGVVNHALFNGTELVGAAMRAVPIA